MSHSICRHRVGHLDPREQPACSVRPPRLLMPCASMDEFLVVVVDPDIYYDFAKDGQVFMIRTRTKL